MPEINITKVQTMTHPGRGRAPVTYFTYRDAIALEVFVTASTDLLAMPRTMFQVIFQVTDVQHRVIFHRPILDWLEHEHFWVLLGDNLHSESFTRPGDFNCPTAAETELIEGSGVYGFRAIIKALQVISAPRGGDAIVDVSASDVSSVHWFRVGPPEDLASLVGDLLNSGPTPDFWPGEPGISARDGHYPGDISFRHRKL